MPNAADKNNETNQTLELLINGPTDIDSETVGCEIILAHGAGAAMDSDFMEVFAKDLVKRGLGDSGLRVVRFEFPYMQQRRKTGKRRPPDREPVLRETWRQVIEARRTAGQAERIFIGGKSLGGRIASFMVDGINQEGQNKSPEIAGLICLGYPFHPTGKPDNLRTAHLETINTPTLIVQGERDTLGNREEVAGYQLSNNIQLHWLADGDHSFVPRKASGRTAEQNWREGIDVVTKFVQCLSERLSPGIPTDRPRD